MSDESVHSRLTGVGDRFADVAHCMPTISGLCSAMPEFDVLDDDSVRIGWQLSGKSFSVHFSHRNMVVILSEPRDGPGWSAELLPRDVLGLTDALAHDRATPFLRRYGNFSAPVIGATKP